jgi:hypothetical protein
MPRKANTTMSTRLTLFIRNIFPPFDLSHRIEALHSFRKPPICLGGSWHKHLQNKLFLPKPVSCCASAVAPAPARSLRGVLCSLRVWRGHARQMYSGSVVGTQRQLYSGSANPIGRPLNKADYFRRFEIVCLRAMLDPRAGHFCFTYKHDKSAVMFIIPTEDAPAERDITGILQRIDAMQFEQVSPPHCGVLA